MPLTIAPLGNEVEIVSCMANGDIKRHMVNIGLIKGEKIIPIAENAGNLIVKVKDCRIALNKELALKIFVR